jgi:hypothetical protein
MAKAAAVITWLYAAGFGLPTFYVAKHLETNQRYDDRTFIRRLHAFFSPPSSQVHSRPWFGRK